MKKFFFNIGAALALALTITLPACQTMDMSRALQGAQKAAQAMTITDAQMAQLVGESVAYMDQQNTVLPESSPYTQRLRRLTKGITQADGIPLNFKVYQTDDVNAFACPDGSVRVYTGIMDMMTDDELLGIIGHEIGHVLKHHSKNAFKQELINSAMMDVLASTNSGVAALTDSQLGTLANSYMSAKFSREQESEADDCGYDFLVANGKNPYGMVMAFEKMEAMEQQSGATQSSIAKMFSSHPDTAKRIKNMTARCQKDGYSRPSSK